MESLTIDGMIKEYGMRLAELEGLYYSQFGIYPSYDCVEFWEDRQVAKIESLLEFFWKIKKEGKSHAS